MLKKRLRKKLPIKQKNLGVLLILVVVGMVLFTIITILGPPSLTGYWSKDGITYSCENCTDCTSAIADASSGDIIKLTADISGVVGTCIDFNGADITFDCQGYYIDGDDTGTDHGIYLYSSPNNNTIKNCNITDFYSGIYVYSSSNNTFTNITTNSNNFGIYLYSSSNNTLINITSNLNTNYGIYLATSSNNVLKNNNMSNNTYNLRVEGSKSQHFNNDIDTSNIVDYSYKIYYNYSISNYVFNLITAPEAGTVVCASCDNVTYSDLNLSHNNYMGLYFFNTTNSRIQNIISNSNAYGIYLHMTSNHNTLSNITSNSNSADGMYIYSSSNNTLTNITLNLNDNGITLSACSNHTLTNITAQENTIYDISVSTSQDSHCNNNFVNVTGSGGRAIEYYNSSATIENKELSQLILCNADSSTVDNVTVSGSDTLSNNLLYIYRTDNSSLSNINSSNNRFGIYLSSSSNNTLTNITSNSNSECGIHLRLSSNNNILKSIILNLNNDYGIYLGSSSNNILTNVNSSNSNSVGIFFYLSLNSTLTNITSNSNTQHGIYLSSSSNNTLTNITSNSNSECGIYFVSNSDNNSLQNITSNLNTNYGIYFSASSNNILTNIISNNNSQYGIYLLESSKNTLTNITSNSNTQHGIYLSSSSNNTLKNNNLSNNSYNFAIIGINNSHFDNDIDTSNIVDYSYKIYYNYSISNYVFNLITAPEAGTVICVACDNITVKDLNLSHFNYDGLHFFNTTNSRIQNITLNSNYHGIYLGSSSNNTLTNITANNNDYGVYFYLSSNNTLQNMTINSNSQEGIWLDGNSDNNTITNSHIENNTNYGIYFLHSGSDLPEYNLIYNNIFNNTVNYGNSTALTNYFNTTNTSGTNIINGSWIGGNYWGYPNGTGFSDICADADSDGICTLTYSLDGLNYDYLPLAGGGCLESWTCTTWSTCVSSLQTRTCTDANSCGTTVSKPAESQSCTVTPGGSGSAPGIIADQPTTTATWDVVEPGTPLEMEITNPEIGITRITVDVSETVTDVSIKVTKIDVVPLSDIKIDLNGDTYQSFQIKVTGLNDTNIESVVIDFKVNKTWLDETGTIEEIILYRKEDTGNKWDELTTTFVSSDDDYYYFLATSPSFSSFTIALKIARMIECIPEEKKCVGNILQQCSANGMTWETIETCDYKCSRNKCVAEFEFSVLIFYIITVVLSVGIFVLIFVGYRYFSKRKLVQQAEKRIEISKNRREDYLEKS